MKQWCVEKEPESESEGWAQSKMVMRRPGGGTWVPSVGRVKHIGVDPTLSNCANALVVTAGSRRACWFNVG